MKTKVHKNLINNRWAITQGGQVVGYADEIVLSHVSVAWSPKKRAFSQGGGKRTVHCWAVGEALVAVRNFQPLKGRTVSVTTDINDWATWKEYDHRRVRYNPSRDTEMQLEGSGDYVGSPYAVFTDHSQMFAIVG